MPKAPPTHYCHHHHPPLSARLLLTSADLLSLQSKVLHKNTGSRSREEEKAAEDAGDFEVEDR